MNNNLINLESIELLDAINQRGSYEKAAEHLNKATSAISYGVKKLEDQLDITVFQRQGRRSVLTPAGRIILEEGKKIINSSVLLKEEAQRIATGWEPRLRIALESMLNHQVFFKALSEFMQDHEKLEVDISESVLNGGWEALEQDRVDLLVGVPGPAPLQKGFKTISMGQTDLVPVISSIHPLAKLAGDRDALVSVLPKLRRVVMHDTSIASTFHNAGLSLGKNILYVQTIDQKIDAQLSGLGIGHLPRYRIQSYLDSGRFIELNMDNSSRENFLAWKSCNKGKALKSFSSILAAKNWEI